MDPEPDPDQYRYLVLKDPDPGSRRTKNIQIQIRNTAQSANFTVPVWSVGGDAARPVARTLATHRTDHTLLVLPHVLPGRTHKVSGH
jgi:hypothetical protein